MSKFNFRPFSGDKLTHRIEYTYSCGTHVSCPANYATDALAIESALMHAEDAIKVDVLKYRAEKDHLGLYRTDNIFSKLLTLK